MSTVYHYCTIDAFMSIISSGTIRASNIQKSNDITEIRNAIDIFSHALSKAIYEFNKTHEDLPYELQNFLRTWKTCDAYDYMENMLDNNALIYYCACFSEARDLLSQWRGYGDDGKGVCIGFEDICFEPLKDSISFDYRPVHYVSSTEIEKWYSDILTDLNFSASKNATLVDYENLFNHIISKMVYEVVFYKDQRFSEEREHRLVFYPFGAVRNLKNRSRQISYQNCYDPFFDKMIDIIDHRIECSDFYISSLDFSKHGNTVKSYVDINFKEKISYIISEIILGPKTKMDDLELRLFLYKHGLDPRTVKIRESDVTLQ